MPELSYLALLACPVGMGLMMWMMMRGESKQEPTAADAVNKQAELTQLQAQIDQLKAEHDNRRTQAAHQPSS